MEAGVLSVSPVERRSHHAAPLINNRTRENLGRRAFQRQGWAWSRRCTEATRNVIDAAHHSKRLAASTVDARPDLTINEVLRGSSERVAKMRAKWLRIADGGNAGSDFRLRHITGEVA